MINPDELVDAVRDALQSLDEVVALVSDAGNIASYDDSESSLLRAISAMKAGRILVAWGSMEPVDDAGTPIRHQITIYARNASGQRLGDYMEAILNGIPDGGIRAPFSNPDDIDTRFEIIGFPLCSRVTDENSVDYLQISIVFAQKVPE